MILFLKNQKRSYIFDWLVVIILVVIACGFMKASWFQLGDFSQVELAYLGELGKLTKAQLATDDNLKLQQMLAEFFVDLGLYDGARYGTCA